MARVKNDEPVLLDAPQDLAVGLIERLSCPPGKTQAFLRDLKSPGLRVRVTAAGAKSYVFEAKLRRNTIRITVGDVRAWTIDKARAEANRYRVMIDSGTDPRAAARELDEARAQKEAVDQAEAVLVEHAWNEYLLRGRPKKKAAWKPRYLADLRKMAAPGGVAKKRGKGLTLAGPIAPLLSTKLKDISPKVLRAWHQRQAIRGPVQADRAVQMFSGFLRWCSTQDEYDGIVDPSAARDAKVQDALRSTADSHRTDAIEHAQLGLWFEGVGQLRNSTAAAYLQGLLLTGARREELAALKWADVDFRWKRMTIADKVGDTRTLPLAPYLRHLLHSLPRLDKNEHVFAVSTSKLGRIVDPRSAHAQALAFGGLPHVTLHGLRRTFSIMGEAAGCPDGAINQIMGHRPGSVSEKYRPRTIDQLRAYMAQVEQFILDAAGVSFDPGAAARDPGAKVVPIEAAVRAR